jgi:hypothetical protein
MILKKKLPIFNIKKIGEGNQISPVANIQLKEQKGIGSVQIITFTKHLTLIIDLQGWKNQIRQVINHL